MVRSDKNPLAAAGGEGEEIDRIMKEIEDLEKKMDTDEAEPAATAAPKAAAPTPNATSQSDGDDVVEETGSPEEEDSPISKVVPMRPAPTHSHAESLAETDAVPPRNEPLVRSEAGMAGEGGLSLKIGGCTEVNLEFTRGGMSVTLSCSDDGLSITTDQGAEFRIPFKRTA